MKKNQTTEKTKIHSRDMKYAEILKRRTAIKTEIEDTKKEYQEVSGLQSNALTQARETDQAAYRHKKTIQLDNKKAGLDRDFMEPQQKERLKMLEQNAADADQYAAGLIKRKKELNAKITALQNDLANFDLILSTKEVLSYQDDLKVAKDKVDHFSKAIANQNDIIEEAQNKLPPFPENAKKREDLLAKIATGEASSDSLEKLDQQIEAEHKEFENKQAEILDITVPAQGTIKGLDRRLTRAKSELAEIESKKPLVLSQFMRGEANRLGDEYVELALKLVEKFEQLIALDNIMGTSERLRVRDSNRFFIPLLNVKACKDKGHHDHSGQFWAVRNAFSDSRTAECQQAEHKRITDLGIQL